MHNFLSFALILKFRLVSDSSLYFLSNGIQKQEFLCGFYSHLITFEFPAISWHENIFEKFWCVFRKSRPKLPQYIKFQQNLRTFCPLCQGSEQKARCLEKVSLIALFLLCQSRFDTFSIVEKSSQRLKRHRKLFAAPLASILSNQANI